MCSHRGSRCARTDSTGSSTQTIDLLVISDQPRTHSTTTVPHAHTGSPPNQSASTIPRVGGACDPRVSNERARWARRTGRFVVVLFSRPEALILTNRPESSVQPCSRAAEKRRAARVCCFHPLPVQAAAPGTVSQISPVSLGAQQQQQRRNNAWEIRGDSDAQSERKRR